MKTYNECFFLRHFRHVDVDFDKKKQQNIERRWLQVLRFMFLFSTQSIRIVDITCNRIINIRTTNQNNCKSITAVQICWGNKLCEIHLLPRFFRRFSYMCRIFNLVRQIFQNRKTIWLPFSCFC